MNIPIQAQPVFRGGYVTVRMNHGVLASGDCGTGQHCCMSPVTGNLSCEDCPVTVFGHCISTPIETCAIHAEIPSDSC
jgi:hypothetical protein